MKIDVVSTAGRRSYHGPGLVRLRQSAQARGKEVGEPLSFLSIIGLILLVAFVVLLLTGWRFGLQITHP
jgi:hypothetical protein